jgi:hypothetical protein
MTRTVVDLSQSKSRTSANDGRRFRNVGKLGGLSSNVATASGGVGQHITVCPHQIAIKPVREERRCRLPSRNI